MSPTEKWGGVGQARSKCLYCGKTFVKSRQNQKYCDNEECEFFHIIDGTPKYSGTDPQKESEEK